VLELLVLKCTEAEEGKGKGGRMSQSKMAQRRAKEHCTGTGTVLVLSSFIKKYR
jgi:hypothetical protein